MAIKKRTSGAHDLSTVQSLVTWLNDNKTGTVLEDVTFSYETKINNVEWAIYMTKGDNTIEFDVHTSYTYAITGGTSRSFAKFNTQSILNMGFYANNNFYWLIYIEKVFMCKYGLIIQVLSNTTGSGSENMTSYISYHTPLLVTIDNNGDLTTITPYQNPICGYMDSGYFVNRGAYSSVEINGYRMKTPSSSYTSARIIGISSNYATSLQHFISYDTSGNGYYTPFAYYSTAEQFTPDDQSTLGVVMLNNTKYITNGRWYIKDED